LHSHENPKKTPLINPSQIALLTDRLLRAIYAVTTPALAQTAATGSGNSFDAAKMSMGRRAINPIPIKPARGVQMIRHEQYASKQPSRLRIKGYATSVASERPNIFIKTAAGPYRPNRKGKTGGPSYSGILRMPWAKSFASIEYALGSESE
jgi:hypothetical protein